MSSYQTSFSQELLDRNAKYAEGHKPQTGQEHWGKTRRNAIITCMDSRINPQEQLGLAPNSTVIIRNAGGTVAEALTTILISQRIGIRHFMVLKHSDCGGFRLQGSEIIDHFKAHTKNPQVTDEVTARVKDFGFGNVTVEEVVKKDVDFLRESPLIFDETEVSGWVFDDETGKVRQIM